MNGGNDDNVGHLTENTFLNYIYYHRDKLYPFMVDFNIFAELCKKINCQLSEV